MQTYHLLLLSLSASLLVSACQQKAEVPNISAQPTEPLDTLAPEKVSETKEIKGATVDAQTCTALNRTMQKVDSDSKIEAIYDIQDQLKACLPTANNAEVMALLKSYHAMYSRFLASGLDYDLDSESDYETFNSAIYELYYGEGLSSAQLKTLTPRDQYLVGLVKSEADVSIYDEGEGYFSFTHNLKAMADIFTPYLRKDQRLFIERMAVDNQESFWSDASVTVSFEGLIERALFWEDYIQRYPDGYAVKDAKILLNLYQHALFFGSDNTSWTDDAIRKFIEPQFKQQMMQSLKRPNSTLAENVRTYLTFMTMTDSERQQAYPVPKIDEDGYEIEGLSKVRYHLRAALPISSPWDVRHYRDCLNGVFCEDDIDFASLDVSSSFASVCSSAQSEPMQIQKDLKVWGFEADFANKDLQCEPLNLRDYASYDCRFGMDWRQEPHISTYNDRGWYKDFYDAPERCELALKGHLAADNEKS